MSLEQEESLKPAESSIIILQVGFGLSAVIYGRYSRNTLASYGRGRTSLELAFRLPAGAANSASASATGLLHYILFILAFHLYGNAAAVLRL